MHFCEKPGEQFNNAYWNGDQMVFGEGYAAPLDVTAHELTHAITDRTADLVYQCQSGALNESFSDIFASNVDTDDWEIGEDLPNGAIRDMSDPGRFGDPAHVDDYDTRPNDGDPANDHGAVHSNSGIPNHAYYLIVQNIGRKDAEQVMYRVLTEELGPDSDFEDFRTASLKVARDLFGEGSSQVRADRPVLRGRRPRRDLGGAGGGGMLRRFRRLARSVRDDADGSPDRRTRRAARGGGLRRRGRVARRSRRRAGRRASSAGPLTYSRGGGIDGRTDKLVVQPDGTGSLTTKVGRRARREARARPDAGASRTRSSAPTCPASPRTRPPAGPSRTRSGTASSYQGATVTTESGSHPGSYGPAGRDARARSSTASIGA